MPLSRRSFLSALGLGGAGTLAAPAVASALAPLLAGVGGRGHEALAAALADGDVAAAAAERAALRAGAIRLSSNENPRGPAAAALDAMRAVLEGRTPLGASRYHFDAPTELATAIGAAHGVPATHVILGCGSSEILRMAVDAHCGPGRAVITAAPTYEEPARRGATVGAPVHAVPVDAQLRLDLGAMAERAREQRAGLVFLNNPNNPTGTVHGAAAIRDVVARIRRETPGATILIDEAYHEYVDDPTYATAVPLALDDPQVLVARTFSKAQGLAGLRVGYAIGRPEALAKLQPHRLALGLNALGAAAALGALGDRELAARERRLNGEARAYVTEAFRRAGYVVAPSQANFLMVDVRQDPKAFQEACRAQGVLVGRPFPPLATQARISIGTMEEMRAAMPVFAKVLGARLS